MLINSRNTPFFKRFFLLSAFSVNTVALKAIIPLLGELTFLLIFTIGLTSVVVKEFLKKNANFAHK